MYLKGSSLNIHYIGLVGQCDPMYMHRLLEGIPGTCPPIIDMGEMRSNNPRGIHPP